VRYNEIKAWLVSRTVTVNQIVNSPLNTEEITFIATFSKSKVENDKELSKIFKDMAWRL